jgi:HEPN domain-containing protein
LINLGQLLEDRKKLVDFWVASSDNDWVTMKNLVESKDFSWSLFIGHLVIEKLFKAYYIEIKGEHPLFIHDLSRLAEKCSLELTKEQSDWLEVVTRFNLKARYEDYKENFRLVCTAEFTALWIERIEILRQWLKEKL